MENIEEESNDSLNISALSSSRSEYIPTSDISSELSDSNNYLTVEEKFDRLVKDTRCSQLSVPAETENNCSKNVTKEIAVENIFNILSDEGRLNQLNEIEDESEIQIKRKYKKGGTQSALQFRKQNKEQKDMGKVYVNRKGQERGPKKMKKGCTGCKYKCSVNISDEERQQIFTNFWKLGNSNLQTQYIISHIQTRKCEERRMYKGKKRESNTYFLEINNIKSRVCLKMFTDTLSISRQKAKTSLKKKTVTKSLKHLDLRGKHEPKNKTSIFDIQFILSHIQSYPAFNSHYSRRKSERKYLHPDLNLSKMYDNYINLCREENRQPRGYQTYRKAFKTLNLAFKHPYNDTCGTCDSLKMQLNKNKNISQIDKDKLENQLKMHVIKYTEAYEEKKTDKDRARQNPEICVKAMDLQKVLETPFLHLSTFNLTRLTRLSDQRSYLLYVVRGRWRPWL